MLLLLLLSLLELPFILLKEFIRIDGISCITQQLTTIFGVNLPPSALGIVERTEVFLLFSFLNSNIELSY